MPLGFAAIPHVVIVFCTACQLAFPYRVHGDSNFSVSALIDALMDATTEQSDLAALMIEAYYDDDTDISYIHALLCMVDAAHLFLTRIWFQSNVVGLGTLDT